MARRKCIGIRQQLTSLISPQKLTALANECGFVKRFRKIKASAFFWTVVLGFSGGAVRTIAGFRRSYKAYTGVQIAASSFYKRLSGEFVSFLRAVLKHLLGELAKTKVKYQGIFAQFDDVLLMDATVVRLHRLLEKHYPSCWTNHTKASAKFNMVISLKDATPRSIQLSEGRRHEAKNRRSGKWVKGKLLIFDLGYFNYQHFDRIDHNGGFFISRLKKNANPVITKAYRLWRGNSIDVEGMHLRDISASLRRQVLDVQVEVAVTKRSYNGTRRKAQRPFRLVGILNEETGEHHYYVTNISPDDLSPDEVARAYEARWQIELLFNELKTHYRFDQIKTKKKDVAEALLYASVITLIASKQLLRAVRKKVSDARVIPDQRWGSIFAKHSQQILEIILKPLAIAKALARDLETMFLHEAPDPNIKRLLLRDRVEMGIAQRDLNVASSHA